MESYGSFAYDDPKGLPLQMILCFAAVQKNK